jgi:hypothetical protein
MIVVISLLNTMVSMIALTPESVMMTEDVALVDEDCDVIDTLELMSGSSNDIDEFVPRVILILEVACCACVMFMLVCILRVVDIIDIAMLAFPPETKI